MKLYVLIDYQVDFVTGSLGFQAAKSLDLLLLRQLRTAMMEVERGEAKIVVTMDTHKENYLETREGRHLPVVHCIDGSDGHKVFGKTGEFLSKHRDKCCWIPKATFGVDPFELVKLRADIFGPVTEILLCGLDGCICVPSNIACFQAAFPEAQIVLDASLTDSGMRPAFCEMLELFGNCMQVEVLSKPRFCFALGDGLTKTVVSGVCKESYPEAVAYAAQLHQKTGETVCLLMYRGEETPMEQISGQDLAYYLVQTFGKA